MRVYASRRSVERRVRLLDRRVRADGSRLRAEPAPTRAKRTQQTTTAIRVCLQILNVSSGEEGQGIPLVCSGRLASLEDSASPIPRFRRNQTRPLHALRTTIRRVPLGPGRSQQASSGSRTTRARYGLTSRNSIAVVVLWTIVLASAAGFWPAARVPGPALVSGSLLGAFALWTGLSALWAASAEKAFNEFDRVFLFLAIFALAVVAAPRGSARRWLAGLALGLTAVGVIALVSRLFPHSFGDTAQLAQAFPDREQAAELPGRLLERARDPRRVRDPVPPLLRGRVARGRPRTGRRAAPGAHCDALPHVVTRRLGRRGDRDRRPHGADLAALGDSGSPPHRRRSLGRARLPSCSARDELVDSPLTSSVAESQGRSAALLIALLCASAGVAYGLLAIVVPSPPRASRAASTAFAAVLVLRRFRRGRRGSSR